MTWTIHDIGLGRMRVAASDGSYLTLYLEPQSGQGWIMSYGYNCGVDFTFKRPEELIPALQAVLSVKS